MCIGKPAITLAMYLAIYVVNLAIASYVFQNVISYVCELRYTNSQIAHGYINIQLT